MIKKLKTIPFFQAFDNESLEELWSYIKIEEYDPGHTIFAQGEQGKCMYIIERGEVEIDKKGRILDIFGPGDIFGEMALFSNEKRSANATAKNETVLYRLSNQDFHRILSKNPKQGIKVLLKGIKEIANRLKKTSDMFIAAFRTGRIAGADYRVEEMAEKVIDEIIENIDKAEGGTIIILNPITSTFEICYQKNINLITSDNIDKLIEGKKVRDINIKNEQRIGLGIPVINNGKIIGYIFIEKKGPGDFTTEQKILISTIGNQVGLGIIKAYNRQEEKARDRLMQSKMRKY
ncbi:MAG: cyclic nucleotide-binding domain-containing protein [Elusimicrobiota bacterium]